MTDKNPILEPLNGRIPRFTEEQLQFIEQWFDENAEPIMVVNDDPPINAINDEQFAQFLRLKMFHIRDYNYPSKGEIIDDVLKLRTKGLMNKEIFLYMLDKYVKVPDIKHELNLAFEVFDIEKKSYLDIDELQTMFTIYDEQFDPSELREFLRDANVKGTGTVDYKEFIDRMFAICPDLTDLEPKLFLYENPDDDPSVEKPPPDEELASITKLINEGLAEDNISIAAEKPDANEAEIALTEGTTEIKDPIDAKSEASEPAAASDVAKSDITKSEIANSNVAKSDVAKSDVAKSDFVKSDVTQSDVAKSDVAKSDVTQSDVAKSDVAKSDVTKSDVATSDVTKSNVATSDVAQSDVAKSDVTKSDVTKSPYSDITTEKPLESVRLDDQGYDADFDDAAFDK